MPEPGDWRTIDDLARLVGHYSWTEHRIFEVAGGWAGGPADDDAAAEVRVWCAAVSRRHAELARAWAERLPVRAGVDGAALVAAPPGPLARAFDDLAAVADPAEGASVLVGTVLGCLERLYGRHLDAASPVSEAPVAEVLTAARRVLEAEQVSATRVLWGMQSGGGAAVPLADSFEQAFDEIGVLPAVRPS